MEPTEGVYRAPWLVQNMFVWFALDNTEFLESTPSGMNTLHGTVIAVYRTASDSFSALPIDTLCSETLRHTFPCEILPCDNFTETNNQKVYVYTQFWHIY